jgi:hypothetical protein
VKEISVKSLRILDIMTILRLANIKTIEVKYLTIKESLTAAQLMTYMRYSPDKYRKFKILVPVGLIYLIEQMKASNNAKII